jgi:succinyl-CoA synthetase beta subunit
MVLAIDTTEMITTTTEQTTTEEATTMEKQIPLEPLPIKTQMLVGIRNHKPLKTM